MMCRRGFPKIRAAFGGLYIDKDFSSGSIWAPVLVETTQYTKEFSVVLAFGGLLAALVEYEP